MSKPPPDNANLQAALRYAEVGWPVHPLVPGEKVPVTRNGLKDATTDPGQIHHWWDNNPGRNVGIATGTPGPDVVDVDVKHGDGYASWNRLDDAGLVSRPMALVRTPSGGQHAYFRGTEQGNGSIKAANVDFRSKGGYVVAPPSTVGGKPYVVTEHANSDATADWTAIRQILDPEPARQASPGTARPSDPSTTLDRVANWAARAQAGDRNFPLFYAAKQAALAGADPAEIRDRLMRSAELNGLEGGPREARATIESGIRDAGAGGGHRPFVPPQPRSATEPAATAKTPEPASPSPKGATVATGRTLEGAELDQEIDRQLGIHQEPGKAADWEPTAEQTASREWREAEAEAEAAFDATGRDPSILADSPAGERIIVADHNADVAWDRLEEARASAAEPAFSNPDDAHVAHELSRAATAAQDPDLGEIFDRYEELAAADNASHASPEAISADDGFIDAPDPADPLDVAYGAAGARHAVATALGTRDEASQGRGGLGDSWLGGDDGTRPPDPQMEMS